MDDIVWYGEAIKGTNQLAHVIVNLMNNSLLPANGVKCPFHYFFSLEDVKKFTSDTVPSWPIVFKVAYSSGQIYYPTTLVKNVSEFKEKVKEVEAQDPEAIILVSLPLKDTSALQFKRSSYGGYSSPSAATTTAADEENENAKHKLFFYLAKDFVLLQHVDNQDLQLLNCDNVSLFANSQLDCKLIYRLVCGRNGWWLDNVIAYDDPRFDKIKATKLSQVLEDAALTQRFKAGYRNGFYGFNGAQSVLMAPLALTDYVVDSYNLGYLIGGSLHRTIVNQVRTAGFQIDTALEDPANLLAFKIFSPPKIVKELENLAKLHNELVSDQPIAFEKLQEASSDLVLSTHGNLNQLLMHLQNNSGMLLSKVVGKFDDDKRLISSFDTDVKYKLNQKTNIVKPQFRILNDEGGQDIVSIRVQAAEFKHSLEVEIDGMIPQTVNSFSTHKLELNVSMRQNNLPKDLSLEDYLKALKNLTYNQPSNAGTDAKYASVFLNEQEELRTEDGTFVCTLTDIMAHTKKSGYEINEDLKSQLLNLKKGE